MAFSTGTYTDVHDVLTQLRLFAVGLAAGWVVDAFVTGSGTGTNGELFIHKGINYWSFDSDIAPTALRAFLGFNDQNVPLPTITACGNTGYSGASNYLNQPGSSNLEVGYACRTQYITDQGPRKYWLFSNATGDYVHMVVNSYPGEYNHILIGELEKAGVYTGGAYICLSWWDHTPGEARFDYDVAHALPFDGRSWADSAGYANYVRADVDSRTWHPFEEGFNDVLYAKSSVRDNIIVPMHYSNFNMSMHRHLWTIPVLTTRTGGSKNVLGYPKDIKTVTMDRWESEQEVDLDDSTTWLIFPAQSKNPNVLPTNTYSGPYGFAYRKIL